MCLVTHTVCCSRNVHVWPTTFSCILFTVSNNSIDVVVFYFMTRCSLVRGNQHVRRMCCFCLQDRNETFCISLLPIYKTALGYSPENSSFHELCLFTPTWLSVLASLLPDMSCNLSLMWKTVLLTWIVGEYMWKVAGLFCVDVTVLWNESCSFNRVKSTHNWKENEYKC